MKKLSAIRLVFAGSAIYDGILGLSFLVAGAWVFQRFQVPPPNHFGYVQFPAALLLVFTLMFIAIARDPRANRNLIPYGVLLKVSYCSVILSYWLTTDLPDLWKPFVLADLVFIALFVWAYLALAQPSVTSEVP